MSLNYNQRPGLREWLRSDGGWLDFSVGFRTEGNGMYRAIVFEDGRARVTREVPGGGPDVTLVFPRDDAVRKMISVPPNEVMNMLMKNELHIEGNLTYMNLFNYYLSLLMKKKNRRTALKLRERDARERSGASPAADRELAGEMGKRKREMLRGPRVDPGVIHLEDPYLSSFSLSDFPRLGKFLDIHFNTEPEICRERPELLTRWFEENGFEEREDGEPWSPVLRQGHAFKHLMENRKPIIRKDDLVAGATTRDIGVVVYPDSHGTMIWGELKTVTDRLLNPYIVSDETVETFHKPIFPFWAKRNFRE